MSEKHLVCKGATVYCDKSVAANNPLTAIPLNITSQTLVEFNGGKVAATDKDNQALNMNFGFCTKSNPPTPCTANIQWMKTHPGAEVTATGGKLLTEESEGTCSCGGGKVKVAFHGQVATPQGSDIDIVPLDLLSRILPVNPTVPKIEVYTEPPTLTKKEGKIKSIEILDENSNPVNYNYKKFVNLPVDKRFIHKSGVKGRYQLGQNIRCRVKFNKGGVHKFKLKIVGGSGNLSYTDTEQGRNDAFKIKYPEEELETALNGELIIDTIFLSQAGGNRYYLEATDSANNVVKSKASIITWRKLFYQEIKLKDAEYGTNNLEKCINTYKEHYIALEPLPFGNYGIINIDQSYGDGVSKYYGHTQESIELRNKYKNTDKEMSYLQSTLEEAISVKYSNNNVQQLGDLLSIDGIFPLLITYADDIIVLQEIEWDLMSDRLFTNKSTDSVSPGSLLYDSPASWYKHIRFTTGGFTLFISTSDISEISNNGKTVKLSSSVPSMTNKLQITLTVESSADRTCDFIKATVKDDTNLKDFIKSIKSFHLYYHVLIKGIGGQSILKKNSIFIENSSMASNILIHEIGHVIGMVPSGPKTDQVTGQELEGYSSLDKHGFFYNDRSFGYNQRGPHCSYPKKNDSDVGECECIMFGSANRSAIKFCPHCTPQVNKLDLSKFFNN